MGLTVKEVEAAGPGLTLDSDGLLPAGRSER